MTKRKITHVEPTVPATIGDKPTVMLAADEVKHITGSGRCKKCGHLDVFHNTHCCSYCEIDGCNCDD